MPINYLFQYFHLKTKVFIKNTAFINVYKQTAFQRPKRVSAMIQEGFKAYSVEIIIIWGCN